MLKKFKHSAVSLLAAAVTLVAVGGVQPASWFFFHQPETPQELLK